MKHIEINIWKACNNKCRFCMSAEVGFDEKKLTAFELVKNEILHYTQKWYTSIGFLWWDISIHPHIFDIIRESKEAGFASINVITNAMVFSDYKKALLLVESWVTRVNISIHSHIEKTEDYLTQVSWWLVKKLHAIDNFNLLHEQWYLKSPLSINIVLNGLNYKNIVETCLFFYRKKNIHDIRINFLWNRYFFSKKDEEILPLSYTDFLPYLKKLIYISLRYDLRITFDSIPVCIFYKIDDKNYKIIIRKFLGEEKDHIEEVSNINMESTFDWKQQKSNELKCKTDTCNTCVYNTRCQWVWKEYRDRYWFDEFSPITKKYEKNWWVGKNVCRKMW